MRFLRSLRVAVPVLLLVAAAVPALACTIESAFINGKFDGDGRFVVTAVLDSQGNPIQMPSFACDKLTMEPGVALAAADQGNAVVYAVGNLDPEHRTLHVTRFTTDMAAADAVVAHARSATKSAGAGSGCCAAKGASAASASAAGAGAACAAKGASAASAGAHCAAKGADAASAGAHCAAKGASAASAGAGDGCCAKGASAASAGAACAAKGADAASAGAACAGDAKSADAKSVAAPTANQIVFAVSGMTCGGCASKVQSAVKAMELTQVTSCDVNVEKATAVLTLAEGQKVDTEAVAKAITAAGFPAKVDEAAKADAKDQPAEKTDETTSTM